MKPLFISFEAIDGAGKSTQAKMLSDWMVKQNIEHILTKEPGTPFIPECQKIRELVLNPNNQFCKKAEFFLFLADRAQHVEKLIIPALANRRHVISDRYMDSFRIYQSSSGISRDKTDQFLEFSVKDTVPDITFLLDMPVEIALNRARKNSKYEGGDVFEQKTVEFHDKIRNGFLKLAKSVEEQHRFYILDVTPPKTKEETHKEIINIISKKIWIQGLNND